MILLLLCIARGKWLRYYINLLHQKIVKYHKILQTYKIKLGHQISLSILRINYAKNSFIIALVFNHKRNLKQREV